MKRVVLCLTLLAACGSKVPETRFYQLGTPQTAGSNGELVLVLEQLATEAGYDDERIVYRTTPFRFDYYQYHRWSASPGVLVSNYLELALERSGKFRAVTRETSDATTIVLGGRVVAIEEVDVSKSEWLGRIVVELVLRDVRTGAVLWTEQYEETEPLSKQEPEGLARALSTAMGRIARRATPVIAEHTQRQAQAEAAATAKRD